MHTYISIYLSTISTHRTSFLFPSHFRVSSSAIVSAIRSIDTKDLSLRASTKTPSHCAKRPRTQTSNSLKRTYAPPNLRVRPLHVRLLVVSCHVLSCSSFQSRSSNTPPTIANHPTLRSTVDCRSTSGSHHTESKPQDLRLKTLGVTMGRRLLTYMLYVCTQIWGGRCIVVEGQESTFKEVSEKREARTTLHVVNHLLLCCNACMALP